MYFQQEDDKTSNIDPATALNVVEENATPMSASARRQSLYVPPDDTEESDDSDESPMPVDSRAHESRNQLNRFLQIRDISPVRNPSSVSWKTANERTKRRYLRKARQSISAVLEVIAPGASEELWNELCERHMQAVSKESQNEGVCRSEKEVKLLEAFAESYLNAQHWSTRRQILSLMADKLSLHELREFIPTITSYRYNIARRHRLLHGRPAPVSCHENRRIRIDPAKLEHFVSFITSPHVIQDVPFGEKLLKLSTGEIIRTPNVVRTRIPERIVQQYQQYCYETNFTTMSKRTLLRILDVCSASVRKSLQGLDNFSAQGSQAFDDLAKLTDNLVDCGKPPEWARDVKQHLRSSKQYLKGDYKVRIIISLFCKVRITGYFPLSYKELSQVINA